MLGSSAPVPSISTSSSEGFPFLDSNPTESQEHNLDDQSRMYATGLRVEVAWRGLAFLSHHL